MILKRSNNLPSGFGHIQQAFLIGSTGMESSSNLFLVGLGWLRFGNWVSHFRGRGRRRRGGRGRRGGGRGRIGIEGWFDFGMFEKGRNVRSGNWMLIKVIEFH